MDIVYSRSQVLAFSLAIVKLAITLAHSTEIKPNGFDSSFTDVARSPRHNLILHRSAKLWMRMTDNYCSRVALRVSAGAPKDLQLACRSWNGQFRAPVHKLKIGNTWVWIGRPVTIP